MHSVHVYLLGFFCYLIFVFHTFVNPILCFVLLSVFHVLPEMNVHFSLNKILLFNVETVNEMVGKTVRKSQ